MSQTSLTIGVLALQGAFQAHAKALESLGVTAKLIRTPAELKGLDGLIIPGGESTTFLKFLERDGFLDALQSFVQTTPTFGTCAGAILLATDVHNPPQRSLGALPMTVERNAYGRQIDSRIAQLKLDGEPLEAVFIRAPVIRSVSGSARVLITYRGDPVLVEEGMHMAATFHPELSSGFRIHRRFVENVKRQTAQSASGVPDFSGERCRR